VIVHEIKRPEPPRPVGLVQQVKDKILDKVSWTASPSPTVPRFMDKVEYTRWLEEKIRPEWPVGTLCTIRAVAPVNQKIPHPLFMVDDLQEVVWMAPYADVTNEPRCVLVRAAGVNTSVQVPYPPGLLRKLTEEELKLVHLRNQAKEEPDPTLYSG
jgi:hypothetical protein